MQNEKDLLKSLFNECMGFDRGFDLKKTLISVSKSNKFVHKV